MALGAGGGGGGGGGGGIVDGEVVGDIAVVGNEDEDDDDDDDEEEEENDEEEEEEEEDEDEARAHFNLMSVDLKDYAQLLLGSGWQFAQWPRTAALRRRIRYSPQPLARATQRKCASRSRRTKAGVSVHSSTKQ
jgi:hypothetical protein